MLCFEINSFEEFILFEYVRLIIYIYILLYFKEKFMSLEIIILMK